jgi:hypothetical protein
MRSHGGTGFNILKHLLSGMAEGDASESTIQLAYKFLLPCRLAFHGVTRFDIPGSPSGYLAILNGIELPRPTTLQEAMERAGRVESKLRSTAVAVFEKPKPSPEFLKSMAQGTITGESGVRQNHLDLALNALNRIVIAHRSVADIDFGESVYPIVLGESVELQVWVYAPAQHTLSDDEVKAIAELQPRLSVGGIGISAPGIDVSDLAPEKIDRIRHVFRRLDQQVFDEFEYASHYFQFQGEEVISLLMAVVALEATHGAFLRKYLEQRGVSNSQTGTYLREQGFTSTLPITAKVFMREVNKPSDEELTGCLKGVTLRNAIMHGNPDMRTKMNQINEARRNVWAVQKRIVDELEHLLAVPGGNGVPNT